MSPADRRPYDPAAESVDDFVARVVRLCRELGPRLPGVDPGDLFHIVESLLRPVGSGKILFVREVAPGVHLF